MLQRLQFCLCLLVQHARVLQSHGVNMRHCAQSNAQLDDAADGAALTGLVSSIVGNPALATAMSTFSDTLAAHTGGSLHASRVPSGADGLPSNMLASSAFGSRVGNHFDSGGTDADAGRTSRADSAVPGAAQPAPRRSASPLQSPHHSDQPPPDWAPASVMPPAGVVALNSSGTSIDPGQAQMHAAVNGALDESAQVAVVSAFCLVASWSVAVTTYSRIACELLEHWDGYLCKVKLMLHIAQNGAVSGTYVHDAPMHVSSNRFEIHCHTCVMVIGQQLAYLPCARC